MMPQHRPVIADLIRNPEGKRLGNATLSNYWLRPWRKLVLALRQYPQGGVRVKTMCSIVTSLRT